VRANTTSVKNPHVAMDFREFLFPNCFDKAMTVLILVMLVLVLLELREHDLWSVVVEFSLQSHRYVFQ
jgi:hypothetical protein